VLPEIEHLGAAMRADHGGRLPSEIPGLQEARRLYKSFGMDPSRHRPSSEALCRRVLKGKSLYQVNSAVDACNLASLSFLLPIGMYDLDRVAGDVSVRVGAAGDEYPGIRKGPVHVADRLALYDAEGPFGSPTSDSARTCVNEQTTRILAVVFATAGFDRGSMNDNLERFAEIFARHSRGTAAARAVIGGRGDDAAQR